MLCWPWEGQLCHTWWVVKSHHSSKSFYFKYMLWNINSSNLFHQQVPQNFPSLMQVPECKCRLNDVKLTFIGAGEVKSRWPGGTVEMCHRANIVENHSAKLLFLVVHLFKDLNFAQFEFDVFILSQKYLIFWHLGRDQLGSLKTCTGASALVHCEATTGLPCSKFTHVLVLFYRLLFCQALLTDGQRVPFVGNVNTMTA